MIASHFAPYPSIGALEGRLDLAPDVASSFRGKYRSRRGLSGMGRGGVSVGVGVGGAYGRVLVASVARSAMAFSYSWHLIKCPATNERFCDPPPGRTKCFRSIGMTTQADGGIPVSNEHHPVDYWDVEALLLDDENRRLPVSQGLRWQDEILLLIAKTYTIGEVNGVIRYQRLLR